MSTDEALSIRKKIDNHEINSIDDVYTAIDQKYSVLLSGIRSKDFQKATRVYSFKASLIVKGFTK